MSGSGKSSMVIKILKEQFYQTPATDIIICVPKDSSEDDSSIKDYKSVDPEKIIIHNGLPSLDWKRKKVTVATLQVLRWPRIQTPHESMA